MTNSYITKCAVATITVIAWLSQTVPAQGLILLPEATLRIITNTISSDGVFNYFVTDTGSPPNEITSIQTATIGGVATNDLSLIAFPTTYRVYQEPNDSWQITVACVSENGSPISVSTARATISLRPFDMVTCTFTNVQNVLRVPLLIIPGVLGTELKGGGSLLWPNIPKMFADVGDDFMDSLRFAHDIEPADDGVDTGKVIGDAFDVFDYSAGLIRELVGQGYTENQDLFTFPYDWRYGVSGKGADGKLVNVEALKAKIESIVQQTGSSKVDVVAHSTGGLVVKKYAIDNPDHHIGKAVFVGVPNTGAVKAVKVLLSGDNFGVPWLADEEMKKIGQNLPVVYDLAPSRTYVNNKGSFFRVVNQKALAKDTTEELGYDAAWDVVINKRGANQAALTNTEGLHTPEFDNFDLRTRGVDLYSIVGCKTSTIGQVVERRNTTLFGNTIVSYDQPRMVPGDSTVPLESATNLPIDSNHKYYGLKTDHGKIMSQDGVRQQIVNIVSGSSLATPDITQDISKCKLNGKAHAIYSPVNIAVTDQAGNTLGFASDGSVQNNIPGASFDVFGDHKFLFLPDDAGQEYTINLKGTGTGTFTYKAQDIVNNEVVETEVFANVPVTTALSGSVTDTSGNANLILDTNGDGTTDETLTPTVLGPQQSQDILSPQTTAVPVGDQGQPGWYRSNVAVSLSATDTAQGGLVPAGVLETRYAIDNGPWQLYLSPALITAEGPHTIKFYSTDKSGNTEPGQSLAFTIDKTPPEVSMQWDAGKKDLAFTAIEGGDAAPTVLDAGNTFTARDKSGNVTVLIFAERNRKSALRAELVGLSYNGVPVSVSANKLLFYWQYDKSGKLSLLSQYAASKKNYNILALYNGTRTTIIGLDTTGLINKTFPTLTLLKLRTSSGTLLWSY